MKTSIRPVLAVTGGASGIGFATAQMWVAEGGRVVLLDLDAPSLASAIDAIGECVRGIAVDVTDTEGVDEAFASIAEVEGRLDALVNAAGIAQPEDSEHITDQLFERMLNIHVLGAMRTARASSLLLQASGRGAIVNVSSIAAITGMPGRASYTAAKAAIEGLTRTLAVEWADRKVRANSVAPGYVQSALIRGLTEDGKLNVDRILERTPMSRLAEPEEIASVINFLLSPKASYVTGATLLVDGGLSVDGSWY